MAASFPETYLDLFNKKAFGSFTTLMPDGSPQTSPVWVDYQDGQVWVNSAEGRQKDKNVRRDPRVAVAIIDPDNPYRYVEVRGRVQEITNEGAPPTSTRWPRNISGRTSIRTPSPARSACSIRSSRKSSTPWDRAAPARRSLRRHLRL